MINEQIRDKEVRLIGEDGEQLGIMSAKEAYFKAKDSGLDLVKISPNAKPPVCKILDYGKFKLAARQLVQVKHERTSGARKSPEKNVLLAVARIPVRLEPKGEGSVACRDVRQTVGDKRGYLVVGPARDVETPARNAVDPLRGAMDDGWFRAGSVATAPRRVAVKRQMVLRHRRRQEGGRREGD